MKKILAWRKHHSIECFGLCLLVLLCMLSFNFATIKLHAKHVDEDFISSSPLYVSTFTTSLSGLTGSVTNVYVNESKTKCAVVLKYDDPTFMSTEAEDYKLFVKNYNVAKGEYTLFNYNNPVGGFYVFGSTGYAMIYLSDSNGFDGHPLEVVVRCTNQLTTTAEQDAEGMASKDASYAKNDQYRVIINPAASTEVVSFLDSGDNSTINATELYQHTVLVEQEEAIRETLKKDVENLNMYANQVESFRARLESLNVYVPKYPSVMASDTFVNLDDEANTLVFVPGYVFDNGVEFDWQSNKLIDGYRFLPEIKGDMSSAAYFEMLSSNLMQCPMITTDNWTMKDGTAISVGNQSDLAAVATVSASITSYVDAVNQYLNAKYNYQTVDLLSYLKLEYNLEATSDTFTSNLGDDALTVW